MTMHSYQRLVPRMYCREDAADRGQLFLIFLSDGSPSDHIEMLCPHGGAVWQPSLDYAPLRNGKPRLNNCPDGNHQVEKMALAPIPRSDDPHWLQL